MNSVYESLADSKEYLLLNFYDSTEIFPHYHKSVELVYCVEGKTLFFINGTKIVLEKDEIFFAPSFAIHSNHNSGKNLILSLVFSNDFMYDFEKTYKNKTLPNFLKDHEFNKTILSYMKEFENICPYKHNQLCRLQKSAFLNGLLWKLAQHYELEEDSSNKKEKKLIHVLSYINEHFNEDITQNSLADHFGYNPQYLSRLFNRTVNCNLSTYLNNLRIEYIEKSLKDNPTGKSLSQIIGESGFGSIATYYRVRAKRNENRSSND